MPVAIEEQLVKLVRQIVMMGDIAPGATVPFTVTAQLSSAPGVKLGTPTPVPLDFTTVDVQVDTVWLNTPTPVPAQ